MVPPLHTSTLTSKVSFLGLDLGDQEGEEVTSDQDNYDTTSAFGCGSIDIKGGPSGPSDMGGLVSLLSMLALPFVMRRWKGVVVIMV